MSCPDCPISCQNCHVFVFLYCFSSVSCFILGSNSRLVSNSLPAFVHFPPLWLSPPPRYVSPVSNHPFLLRVYSLRAPFSLCQLVFALRRKRSAFFLVHTPPGVFDPVFWTLPCLCRALCVLAATLIDFLCTEPAFSKNCLSGAPELCASCAFGSMHSMTSSCQNITQLFKKSDIIKLPITCSWYRYLRVVFPSSSLACKNWFSTAAQLLLAGSGMCEKITQSMNKLVPYTACFHFTSWAAIRLYFSLRNSKNWDWFTAQRKHVHHYTTKTGRGIVSTGCYFQVMVEKLEWMFWKMNPADVKGLEEVKW